MSKQTYQQKLKSPKWQKKRLEIMQRDNFYCQNCGNNDSILNVHHKKYVFGKEIWDYDNDDLITVCEYCHSEITELKKTIKNNLDNHFVFREYLEELNIIVENIKNYNPYDLQELGKYICKKNKRKGVSNG